MAEVRTRRTRSRPPEPPPDRAKVVWAVLTAVLITVLFVGAVITLRGGFAAIVVIAYAVWLWFAARRFRRRRRR
ncbi:MAG: hypothetical protein ACTHJL_13320 [Amnibacterium sp.]